MGAVVVVAVAASFAGSARFRARYAGEKAALLERGKAAPSRALRTRIPASLPFPVRRYLEASGVAGRPAFKVALLAQTGELRAASDKPWMPFESEQAYSMDPPGFVWLARARVAPLVHMLARDKFVDGRGNMLISVLGIFTVADAAGPELDMGAGLRYWGEVVSFPEAVLNPHIRWGDVDGRHARMSVRQDGLEMSAVVEFGADGYPAVFRADRHREVGGKWIVTPWSGHCREWKEIGGRKFPSRWESVWHAPEGEFTAVRMEVINVRTE